jgi:hypothetical protein
MISTFREADWAELCMKLITLAFLDNTSQFHCSYRKLVQHIP